MKNITCLLALCSLSFVLVACQGTKSMPAHEPSRPSSQMTNPYDAEDTFEEDRAFEDDEDDRPVNAAVVAEDDERVRIDRAEPAFGEEELSMDDELEEGSWADGEEGEFSEE